ncbi:DUF4112 domain-containing protein [Jannaschia sp. CCS1]|uniref:DUF4112 domain-containing protein n=1 Tax=Jannaschia sp. (strain CCS1) TaxID=290400 RepID=UPI000053BD13|nr:DUF4112 domain-containing protein [Jannaschia sp. CCS1]ABD54740.1 hypothetical protein Jann_1823 [Jannaschia sp. CCS1]
MAQPSLIREVEDLERLANQLDSAFRIPGTSFRVGYDAIVGLVPGVGDALTFAPSAYIVWKAHQLGVGWPRLLRMSANVAVDTMIGGIPLLGDVFDAAFKSNRRNVALVRDFAERETIPTIYEKGPRNSTARIHHTAVAV